MGNERKGDKVREIPIDSLGVKSRICAGNVCFAVYGVTEVFQSYSMLVDYG